MSRYLDTAVRRALSTTDYLIIAEEVLGLPKADDGPLRGGAVAGVAPRGAREGRARRADPAAGDPVAEGAGGQSSRPGAHQPVRPDLHDDWRAYAPLRREYLDHRIINHSAGIYVDGEVHTNTIEGFFGTSRSRYRGARRPQARPAAVAPVLPRRVRLAAQRPAQGRSAVRAATPTGHRWPLAPLPGRAAGRARCQSSRTRAPRWFKALLARAAGS